MYNSVRERHSVEKGAQSPMNFNLLMKVSASLS